MSNIIGREREQEILKSSMHSKKSEFIVLYGRRRIGKTFLIKEFYNGIFDYSAIIFKVTPILFDLFRFARFLP